VSSWYRGPVYAVEIVHYAMADIRVERNAIKIAKNDHFIECFHDLHTISF